MFQIFSNMFLLYSISNKIKVAVCVFTMDDETQKRSYFNKVSSYYHVRRVFMFSGNNLE